MHQHILTLADNICRHASYTGPVLPQNRPKQCWLHQKRQKRREVGRMTRSKVNSWYHLSGWVRTDTHKHAHLVESYLETCVPWIWWITSWQMLCNAGLHNQANCNQPLLTNKLNGYLVQSQNRSIEMSANKIEIDRLPLNALKGGHFWRKETEGCCLHTTYCAKCRRVRDQSSGCVLADYGV